VPPLRQQPWLTWAGDGLVAVVLLSVGLHGSTSQSGFVPGVLPYALITVAAVSLAVRRCWPLITLGLVTVAVSSYLYEGYPYGPILLCLLVAVYTVARHCATRTAAVAAGVAVLFLAVHVLAGRGLAPGLSGVVPVSAWAVVPLAVGVTVRVNRDAAARARQEWARRHADDERLRVAREVHDVVGHGLSAIAMQAEIALHLLPRQPEHAEVALAAISRTSREALDELRVALAAVRSSAEDRAPLPGLDRLDALVARMSDSGVTVRVECDGERRPLPEAVDLAAYRIVQESLTNVLRHAGPADVTVRLSFGAGDVTVTVTDTGAGPAAGFVAGQGIAGMRQRVAALDGSFSAGPGGAGGFRVQGRIPTP
jgi:signal transduction histidine kinase